MNVTGSLQTYFQFGSKFLYMKMLRQIDLPTWQLNIQQSYCKFLSYSITAIEVLKCVQITKSIIFKLIFFTY